VYLYIINRMSKQDKSPKVTQRGKLTAGLQIKDLKWTKKQQDFIKLALDKETRLIFVSGPAGSSKTLLSIYCSLCLIRDKKVSDIIYVRSPVESSDSKIGFLPGDADEKLKYYNLPFSDKLVELLSKSDIELLNKQNRISGHPLSFVRGMSWNCKSIILDEAQNCTQKEIITLMTRLGKFSKCFILADPEQTDLTNGKVGGFEKLCKLFNDEESKKFGISSFYLTEEDIMRSEIVKYMVSKLKDLSPTSRV
jgi:phosphate starvation-inducible protein PhoH and related proteins